MMKTKRLLSFLTLLAVGLGLFFPPTRLARADTGPKPTMDFKFVYEISPALAVVSGTLYECSDPDCSDAAPLEQMGPQGFSCDAESCSSMAYGYSDYHRLSILFSDGTQRESNVFTSKHYMASYTVHVRESDLLVKETGGSGKAILQFLFIAGGILRQLMGSYCNLGLPVTLVVELLVGLGYVLWRKRSWRRVLATILLMNLVTQPALWLATMFLHGTLCGLPLLLELVVVLVEAWVLYRVLNKYVYFPEAFLLSLVLNLASYAIGLLLPL